jgi:integrase
MPVSAIPDALLPALRADTLPRRERGPAIVSIPRGSLDEVVEAMLSRVLGEGRDTCGSDVYRVNQCLMRYARTEVVHNGVTLPAPDRAMPDFPVPNGATAMRRLGMSRPELREEWSHQVDRSGNLATLERRILEEAFPIRLWPIAGRFVIDGPAVAAMRSGRLLRLLATERPRPTRARPDASRYSPSTLISATVAIRRLMKALCDMADQGYPSPLVERWVAAPRLRVPVVPPADTDRSSPVLEQLRVVWQDLDERVRLLAGIADDEDELEAVRCVPKSALFGRSNLWTTARTRALFVLSLVLGSRPGAICRLRRGDFVSDHITPDGHVVAAIRLCPGKTLDPHTVCWKPIPPRVARLIEVYIAVTDAILAQRGAEAGPDSPLFVGRLTRPDAALSTYSLREVFTGRKDRRKAPLLPRARHDQFSESSRPLWYSPHTLRGAAIQIIREHGPGYLVTMDLHIRAEVVGEALTDREIPSDRYGYADLNTARGRETLSGIGATIVWECLAERRGARLVPDVAAYRGCLERKLAIEAQIRADAGEVDELVRNARRGLALPSDAVLDVTAVVSRRDLLRDQLREVDRELEKLRHDRTTWTAVPDGDERDTPVPDLEAVERDLMTQSDAEVRDECAPVRDWVTVTEFGEVAGVSHATPPRWLKGQHLPHRPGDPRRPWEPDAVPVDETLGPRRRRIWVPGIGPGFFRAPVARQLLAKLLAGWPEGWSEDHCSAPLVLPPPFRGLDRAGQAGSVSGRSGPDERLDVGGHGMPTAPEPVDRRRP